MSLSIVAARGELLERWREVHNIIIPPMPLTADDVAERSQRYELTVAFADHVLVGNATLRAPADGAVTLIVRILPEHRRQGFGGEYFEVLLDQESAKAATRITTVVLVTNVDGLDFARHRGFEVTSRYDINGVDFVEMTKLSSGV
jgi:GNAT superfamily N-acetyltransferase